MATTAEYIPLIGGERIASFKNVLGDDIPPTLVLGPTVPGIYPTKGNRKIILMVQVVVQEVIEANDQTLTLKVKVPDGTIKGSVQRFDASTPGMNYLPVVKVYPNTVGTAAGEGVAGFWNPVGEDVDEQTVDVLITLGAYTASPLFTVEVDWYHSVAN